MDFRDEVKNKIGSISYYILLKAIDDGRIEHHKVEEISVSMGGQVKGVYKEKLRKDLPLKHIFKHMLDAWYTSHLCQAVSGLESLISILEEEGLGWLALEIREAEEKNKGQER